MNRRLDPYALARLPGGDLGWDGIHWDPPKKPSWPEEIRTRLCPQAWCEVFRHPALRERNQTGQAFTGQQL